MSNVDGHLSHLTVDASRIMMLHVLFQGPARDIAGELAVPSIDDFRIDGQIFLP